MKKLTLLTCAFVASTMAFAQTNLATNPVGNDVTVTASASIYEGDMTPDKAIDGNNGTRWGSNGADNTDTEWFQIEWSEAQTFNTIKLLCQAAMNMGAHSYDIQISDNGTDWTTKAQVVDRLTPENEYETIKLSEEVTTKYVRLQGVKKGEYGYTFFEFEVYNNDYSNITLGKFTIPGCAKYDTDTNSATVTFSLLDTYGDVFNANDVEFSIDGPDESASVTRNGDELTINADQAGTYYITAGVTGTAGLIREIVLIDVTAGTPKDKEEDVYAFYSSYYGASKVDALIDKNWFSHYTSAEVVAMDDRDNVYYVTGAGSFGLRRGTPTTSDYKSLKFDIYAFEDVMGTVQLRNGRGENADPVVLPEKSIQLQGGKWNHVEISLDDAVTTETVGENTEETATTIGYVVWTCLSKVTHSLLIDNVYLSKNDAVISEMGVIATMESETECAISGKAKTADEVNAKMNDANVTYYDLTGLELADGITTITPANPNALIFVAKSEDAAKTILTGTNNVIYKNGEAEWLFPVRKLIINDAYPTYTGHFISTENVGYKYTRKVEGSKYVTLSLPVGISVPEGATAYELTDYANDELTFTKVETIAANTPYILYVESAAEIVAEGTGDVLRANKDVEITIEKNGVTFHPNNVEFTATGEEYGLQNATESVVFKKVAAPAKIGAFRAYFTFDDNTSSEAKAIKFVDNETTGISTVATESVKAAGVYSIDGRFINADGSVKNLAKGLYIVNGKKVIVK